MTDSVIGDWALGPAHAQPTRAATGTVRVWDLPTRLFHWLLAASVCGALLTPHLGDTAMPWHFRCGYTALTLVIFRLMWGMVGTRHARFFSFVKGPRAIWAYLRGSNRSASKPTAGHNPLGALSVLAMLAIVLMQAASGLFSNDDIASEGPLAQLIDKALSDQISHWHAHITPLIIYSLIALHIAAIVAYWLFKRVNLVSPMVSGDKADVSPTEAVSDGWANWLRALICLASSTALVWWLIHL